MILPEACQLLLTGGSEFGGGKILKHRQQIDKPLVDRRIFFSTSFRLSFILLHWLHPHSFNLHPPFTKRTQQHTLSNDG